LQVTIELPDDLAAQIQKTSGDIGRRMLEAFAVESYRSGAVTGRQVQQLLGLRDRFELDTFLKRAGIFREYTAEELALDYEASRRASGERSPNS
jgi:predicted HTH domain antitoxin